MIINKTLKYYLCRKRDCVLFTVYPQCLDCVLESPERACEQYSFLSLTPGDADSAEPVGELAAKDGGSRF